MSDPPVRTTVADLYGDTGIDEDAFYARVDQSLRPRAPSMLFDAMRALGLAAGHMVLDIGCRDARHAIELSTTFGCRVLGLDPSTHLVEQGRRAIEQKGVASRVEVREGRIEAITMPDRSFDFVWCRDVLVHVAVLHAAFRECARVLRPGGAMLVFQNFATEQLEPREAERLFASLAVVSTSASVDLFEAAIAESGLTIETRDVIASEWREWGEEHGERRTSRQLLRAARILRARSTLEAELGRAPIDAELADCLWGIYQMIGKLSPRMYVLRRRA
jgi:SAM-dependent methyltransferase